MGKMILSAFADEYAEDFRTQLSGMQRLHIDYIELRQVNGKNVSILSRDEVKEVKDMLDSYGIAVSAIGSPLGKIRLDEDIDAHLETARRVFETANVMGTRLVRIFSFYAPEGQNITDMKGAVLDALERLIILAREYGVTLCHENEARIYGDIPERICELIHHFGGEMKCVFDAGNFVLEGIEPYPQAYALLQKDIVYFHIKDALSAGAVVPPGKGDARIRDILHTHTAYAKENFFVSIEPHLQLFSGQRRLVGRAFENPYQYENAEVAFTDAVTKFRELF